MATVGSGKYTYEIIEDWATPPDGTAFGTVSAVAADSQDRVYVFQRTEPPVLVFDREGKYLSAWGEGRTAAPQHDWKASRLGPQPGEAMVRLADAAFSRMLAACGVPAAMFDANSDGTARRESLRLFHMGTVVPLARLLEHELSRRIEAPIKLKFDGYPRDMVSRAQVFAKMMAAEGMTVEKALAVAGLLEDAA